MANFKIFRETALPGTPQNDSLYVVAPAGTPNYIELYAVNSSGSVRRIPTDADITAKINTALAGVGALEVVADITARDALAPPSNIQVYVADASGDASVASGGATYIYDMANTLWIKISEAESLDIVLDWANIQNKPISTATQIDAAVTQGHAHANKTELDNLGDANGELTYNGTQVKTEWSSTAW